MFRSDGTGFKYTDVSQPGDNYLAENQNLSGYVSMDLHTRDKKWQVFGGLRVEDNKLRILGAQQAGLALYPMDIRHPLTSWLPSINLSWRPDSAWILRTGYGRTVNRPEFREVAPFSYKDFLNLYNYTGNPELRTVNVDNADLRLEWYPKSMLRNEMYSVGVFYKHLDHPIEQMLARYIEDEALYWNILFTNSGPANVYGAEAEIRKSLSFLGGRFARDLSVVMNSSYIYSRVFQPGKNEAGSRKDRKRPLQGQPPYIINLGLHYEDPAKGTKLALIYNRSGEVLGILGNNDGDLYDIMIKGRNQLDFSYTQRITRFLHIKAGIQNILDAPFQQYQDIKRNYKYDPAVDMNYRSYKTGAYYSMALNFIF
jgi:TonB-dependent receptor